MTDHAQIAPAVEMTPEDRCRILVRALTESQAQDRFCDVKVSEKGNSLSAKVCKKIVLSRLKASGQCESGPNHESGERYSCKVSGQTIEFSIRTLAALGKKQGKKEFWSNTSKSELEDLVKHGALWLAVWRFPTPQAQHDRLRLYCLPAQLLLASIDQQWESIARYRIDSVRKQLKKDAFKDLRAGLESKLGGTERWSYPPDAAADFYTRLEQALSKWYKGNGSAVATDQKNLLGVMRQVDLRIREGPGRFVVRYQNRLDLLTVDVSKSLNTTLQLGSFERDQLVESDSNQGELTQPITTQEEPDEVDAAVEEDRPAAESDDIPPTGNADAASPFTVDQAMQGLFLPRSQFEAILSALRRKKNTILQGPPGVGKTFIARRLGYAMIGQEDTSRVEMIQFHQSYAYEDFIQGYRPGSSGGFERRDGVFCRFCDQARKDLSRPYVFIIDEINRGHLGKIFGELMTLVEAEKRGEAFAIPLSYSEPGERFSVPPNLHLLGLMNTADRSLALVDYALRRRFVFFSLKPQFRSEAFREALERLAAPQPFIHQLAERLSALNEKIAADQKNLGQGFSIGHSFFVPSAQPETSWDDWYRTIIKTEIAPLLREYWFDDHDRAEAEITALLS